MANIITVGRFEVDADSNSVRWSEGAERKTAYRLDSFIMGHFLRMRTLEYAIENAIGLEVKCRAIDAGTWNASLTDEAKLESAQEIAATLPAEYQGRLNLENAI